MASDISQITTILRQIGTNIWQWIRMHRRAAAIGIGAAIIVVGLWKRQNTPTQIDRCRRPAVPHDYWREMIVAEDPPVHSRVRDVNHGQSNNSLIYDTNYGLVTRPHWST